ncbi:MAG: hypothetical protein ACLFWG_02215, partial [Longimicrobiales bacterium]
SLERIERGVAGVRSYFGLEEALRNLQWIERGDSVWTHRVPAWPVESWDPGAGWRVISLGIRALKQDPRTAFGERPTGDFLRMMGARVKKRVVDLERNELLELLDRRSVELDGPPPDVSSPDRRPSDSRSGRMERNPEAIERGFVAVRHGGRILGRGWVKDGVLRNEISKVRSRRLLADLGARGTDDGGSDS